MGSTQSKTTEDTQRAESSVKEVSFGNQRKVFDDGVGRKLILPFFTSEPTDEVLKLIEVICDLERPSF